METGQKSCAGCAGTPTEAIVYSSGVRLPVCGECCPIIIAARAESIRHGLTTIHVVGVTDL